MLVFMKMELSRSKCFSGSKGKIRKTCIIHILKIVVARGFQLFIVKDKKGINFCLVYKFCNLLNHENFQSRFKTRGPGATTLYIISIDND